MQHLPHVPIHADPRSIEPPSQFIEHKSPSTGPSASQDMAVSHYSQSSLPAPPYQATGDTPSVAGCTTGGISALDVNMVMDMELQYNPSQSLSQSQSLLHPHSVNGSKDPKARTHNNYGEPIGTSNKSELVQHSPLVNSQANAFASPVVAQPHTAPQVVSDLSVDSSQHGVLDHTVDNGNAALQTAKLKRPPKSTYKPGYQTGLAYRVPAKFMADPPGLVDIPGLGKDNPVYNIPQDGSLNHQLPPPAIVLTLHNASGQTLIWTQADRDKTIQMNRLRARAIIMKMINKRFVVDCITRAVFTAVKGSECLVHLHVYLTTVEADKLLRTAILETDYDCTVKYIPTTRTRLPLNREYTAHAVQQALLRLDSTGQCVVLPRPKYIEGSTVDVELPTSMIHHLKHESIQLLCRTGVSIRVQTYGKQRICTKCWSIEHTVRQCTAVDYTCGICAESGHSRYRCPDTNKQQPCMVVGCTTTGNHPTYLCPLIKSSFVSPDHDDLPAHIRGVIPTQTKQVRKVQSNAVDLTDSSAQPTTSMAAPNPLNPVNSKTGNKPPTKSYSSTLTGNQPTPKPATMQATTTTATAKPLAPIFSTKSKPTQTALPSAQSSASTLVPTAHTLPNPHQHPREFIAMEYELHKDDCSRLSTIVEIVGMFKQGGYLSFIQGDYLVGMPGPDIRASGMGLYTMVDLRPISTHSGKWGRPIAQYRGDRQLWSGQNEDLPHSDYVFAYSGSTNHKHGSAIPPFHIDAYHKLNCIARYANHPNADGSNEANAGFRVMPDGDVWLYTLASAGTITSGSEIIAEYDGDGYRHAEQLHLSQTASQQQSSEHEQDSDYEPTPTPTSTKHTTSSHNTHISRHNPIRATAKVTQQQYQQSRQQQHQQHQSQQQQQQPTTHKPVTTHSNNAVAHTHRSGSPNGQQPAQQQQSTLPSTSTQVTEVTAMLREWTATLNKFGARVDEIQSLIQQHHQDIRQLQGRGNDSGDEPHSDDSISDCAMNGNTNQHDGQSSSGQRLIPGNGKSVKRKTQPTKAGHRKHSQAASLVDLVNEDYESMEIKSPADSRPFTLVSGKHRGGSPKQPSMQSKVNTVNVVRKDGRYKATNTLDGYFGQVIHTPPPTQHNRGPDLHDTNSFESLSTDGEQDVGNDSGMDDGMNVGAADESMEDGQLSSADDEHGYIDNDINITPLGSTTTLATAANRTSQSHTTRMMNGQSQ